MYERAVSRRRSSGPGEGPIYEVVGRRRRHSSQASAESIESSTSTNSAAPGPIYARAAPATAPRLLERRPTLRLEDLEEEAASLPVYERAAQRASSADAGPIAAWGEAVEDPVYAKVRRLTKRIPSRARSDEAEGGGVPVVEVEVDAEAAEEVDVDVELGRALPSVTTGDEAFEETSFGPEHPEPTPAPSIVLKRVLDTDSVSLPSGTNGASQHIVVPSATLVKCELQTV